MLGVVHASRTQAAFLCNACRRLLNFVTFYVFNIFMAALCPKCGHYIFALWFLSIFLLSSYFFPRLISAVGDWMSTIHDLHIVWP